MERSSESTKRTILTTVAMAIAGGAMLVRVGQGDGGVWTVVAVLAFLIVTVTDVFQLASR